jgi:glycerophosphoryl diester phosphodiesterase
MHAAPGSGGSAAGSLLNGKFMAHIEVIAHRGASAYAPENTMPSFDMAVSQDAGCVEHDLHVTKDGALVCLHDRTLDRTTNVREMFPRRGRDVREDGEIVRRWFVHDFTLAEVQQLDAGSWFRAEFAGARVPTFDDLLAWASHRVEVLTELKDPDVYETLGVDPLTLCEAALRRHGFMTRSTDRAVTVQSFHEPTVRRAAALFARRVPVVLLVEPTDATLLRDRGRVTAIAEFASGIGPGKSIIGDHPEIVDWAHEAGLRVTPWTFRTATIGPFESIGAEMKHYLVELGVDAVITDHPDAIV